MLPTSAHHLDLRRLELFHALEANELDALLSHARDRWLEPGDVLFREGDPGDALAIVVRGEVAVSLRDVPMQGAEVAVLGAGALIGEGAFLDPEPRSATVVAAVPSVVLELDPNGFHALRRECPRVAARLLAAILRGVAQKLHAVDRRIAIELGEVSAFAPLSSPPAAEPGAIRSRWPRSTPPSPPRPRTVEPFALRACGVTLDCSDDDLGAMLSACEERHFAGGEVLSSQGSEARSCYFVLAGEVEVVKALMNGERVLTTLGAGSIVGQAALMDRTRRSATLRARRAVTALEMGRDGYERLVGGSGPAALSLQHHLAAVSVRQLREADRRLVAVLARGRGRAPEAQPADGAQPREDRRRRDLQYIQAAVGEVAMDLDVIELGDDDLLPATGEEGASHAPPPLLGGRAEA